MLKVTGLQRIHTKARSKKRSAERKHATHTHSETSCLKPSVTASGTQEALLCLLSKTYYHFTSVYVFVSVCVIACMHYSYYGFRLFLNLAITGHSWHLARTMFFSSNQSLILTVLAAIPSVAHISNPEQGRRHRGWKNSKVKEDLYWNRRKYEQLRTAVLKRVEGFMGFLKVIPAL